MTKKELANILKRTIEAKCCVCNYNKAGVIALDSDCIRYYICKYCFLGTRDDGFDETKELIHYCFRELDNWMDMIQSWEEELFEGKNTKLDLYEEEVDNVMNKLQEIKKLIKGDK